VTSTGAESGKAAARDPKRDVGVFGKFRIVHLIGAPTLGAGLMTL